VLFGSVSVCVYRCGVSFILFVFLRVCVLFCFVLFCLECVRRFGCGDNYDLTADRQRSFGLWISITHRQKPAAGRQQP